MIYILFGEHCQKAVQTPWGEYAWHHHDLAFVLDEVKKCNGVILGGDILTLNLEHTGVNWFYHPQRKRGVAFNALLNANIQESIHCANEKLCCYSAQYSEEFMFVLVVQSALEACIKVI